MTSHTKVLNPRVASTTDVAIQHSIHRVDESKSGVMEAIRLGKKVFYPLLGAKLPHLGVDELENFGVTLTSIDFSGGKLKSGEQFLEPIDPDVIEGFLRGTQVSTKDLSPNGPDDLVYDNYRDAQFFCSFITQYLTRYTDDDPTIIDDHTLWVDFENTHQSLFCPGGTHQQWAVENIFRWCLDTRDRWMGDSPDPDKPHTTCLLADKAPLSDGGLSTAELSTVVTVVSTSGRKARIVQGIVDFATCTTEVRVSDTVSFESGGVQANLREWWTLPGWVVGKPVGNTK